jgi:diguanylate cyclase (GGDEF)-like protein
MLSSPEKPGHRPEQARVPAMSGALLAVIAIMTVLGAMTFLLDERANAQSERHRQLAANIERIRYFDEALTMSARYAAASGDLSYRDRYDGFAPQLDALIQETIVLAANPYAEAKIRSTDTANVRLVEIETQAFELVAQGRGDEALALLDGTEYVVEKQRYSVGLEGAITEIDGAARAEDQQEQAVRWLVPLLVILAGVVIVAVWVRYRRSTAELLVSVNLAAKRSAVLARLSEQLTFALEEDDLVEAAGGALAMLVPTDGGDLLVLDAPGDRLVVGTSWGAGARDPGTAVPIDRPSRCPAIRRGVASQSEDLGAPLVVRCPAHPVERGSVLCVPLLALGQTIGALHLVRDVGSFDLDEQRQAGRLAEQVALALSNARLLRTMEGLAMADPLTGLYNMRFFDPLLDREIAISEREGTPVGLLMVDVDHFKGFNDTYGHQAGDAALRSFAGALRATVRESDTVARYGGEEFVVLLHGADLDAAAATAEKLRTAVEQLVIELGPGRFARLTGSFGVASTDAHGHDRTNLVAVADQALYRAKQLGRNRVVIAKRTRGARPKTAAGRTDPAPIRPVPTSRRPPAREVAGKTG